MVESEMMPERKISDYDIEFLNLYLKNKRSTFDFLTGIQNYYLPKFDCKAITDEFLLKILTKKAFAFKRDQIKIAPDFKMKVGLIELVQEINKKAGERDFGLDHFYCPDKTFLANVLYTLD